MTLKELVQEIAKREGKKREVRVGDVREIVGHLCDIMNEQKTSDLLAALVRNGLRRAKRKK